MAKDSNKNVQKVGRVDPSEITPQELSTKHLLRATVTEREFRHHLEDQVE